MTAESSEWHPLNDFQQLMVHWATERPFNVVEAIESLQPGRPEDLAAAANAELAASGVAYPILNARGSSCRYHFRTPTLKVQQHVSDDLDRLLSSELNQPFERDRDPMIRLWMAEGKRQVIGMTWQHFACDGFAAGDLFRRILARYLGLIPPRVPLRRPPPASWRKHFATRRIPGYVLDVLGAVLRGQHVQVPKSMPGAAFQVQLVNIPGDVLGSLQKQARRLGASVNDVLNAMVSRVVADSPACPGRSDMGLCNFVNLRSLGNHDLSSHWGQFLGFMALHLPRPLPQQIDELTQQIARLSRGVKEGKWFFSSLFGYWLASRLMSWLPAGWGDVLTAGILPFTAALTNLRLPQHWAEDIPPGQLGAYWSAVPSIHVPLTVSARTWGQTLTLALTFNNPGPLMQSGEWLAEKFRSEVMSFAELPHESPPGAV